MEIIFQIAIFYIVARTTEYIINYYLDKRKFGKVWKSDREMLKDLMNEG